MKADILAAVQSIRARKPEAGDYLHRHLVFDDNKETIRYTGDSRLGLEPMLAVGSPTTRSGSQST